MGKISNYKRLLGDQILRWYNSEANVQVTVQETVGRARQSGNYETLIFHLNTGLGATIVKRFPTKEDAEKFAINWMRQHPNG